MTPGQCRAARAFLDISQPELASAASVGVSTVRDFEAGRRQPMANNLKAIQAELERRGVRFVGEADSKTCGVLFGESGKSATAQD
ncbi:helix-turn-helix domain-containing protein [Methylosinus trichosporium]|uniref:Transcriptional regulator n=2 Tax=Methylocystaceae TaxID=31993 RepID=A0A2D2D356_METT3|nr:MULTISPECIES: helix-turn-helix domain-containing protein [Methylosinus]ATQ69299.1 transcriptional regulator [Methylosinus trichosporium OB3b]